MMGCSAALCFAAETPNKPIPIARVKHSGPVDFEREVLPILRNNCLACHNQTKPKGGLILETPQSILKGGDNGPAVVPKKPVESLLLKAAAHEDPELIMPPPENKAAAMPLTSQELGLFALWIEQGAKGEVRASAPIVWQPIPPGLNVIYAVALTRDGQFAACGRANQIFVYHLPTRQLVARLNDPQLQKSSNAGAAHRDTVNALAFSPDGELLASGGYREVKLWRRVRSAGQVTDANSFSNLLSSGKVLAATITNGQLRVSDTNGVVVRTNAFPKTLAELKGDFRARFVAGERERELAFARAEIDFRKSGLKTAETNQSAAVARQKKAAETNAALAKIALEKAAGVTNAVASKHEAEKGIQALGPEVAGLVEAFFAAEKEFTNATALAKSAKDRSEKKADELAATALTKSNALETAKAALDKLPAETKAAQKLATEKLVAANKAIADAEKEFAKADLPRKTSQHELELADAAVRKTDAALAAAKTALADAESEAKKAAAGADTARQALAKTESAVRVLAHSSNEHALVTLDEAGAVRWWSTETGEPFEADWRSSWKLERVIGSGDHNSPLVDRVNALRFTPDGQQLITGGGEPTRGGEIKVWRVKDGVFVRELANVHSDSVFALDVSADGRFLASGAADRFAKVLELASGKVVKTLEGHTHHVLGVSWKRDGRTLITAGADNVAKVWDATTGERRKNIDGFGKEVTATAFVGVSDEAILAAGDGQVVLAKTSGEKPRTFNGASDYVYATAVTADGEIVLAGGADGVLRAWNGKSGKPAAEFGAQ